VIVETSDHVDRSGPADGAVQAVVRKAKAAIQPKGAAFMDFSIRV
jgi:hypothetical protein